MNVSTVIALLNLIINVIRLALYISKNKKEIAAQPPNRATIS